MNQSPEPSTEPGQLQSPFTVIGSVGQTGGTTNQTVNIAAPPTESVDFGGHHHRNPSVGVFVVDDGPEVKAYSQMAKPYEAKNWTELERAAGRVVSDFPNWLTGYLFLGIAQANLGKRDLAIASLKHVDENAHGNPEYQDAKRILGLLQTAGP